MTHASEEPVTPDEPEAAREFPEPPPFNPDLSLIGDIEGGQRSS